MRFTDEHAQFRRTVRDVVVREIDPDTEKWEHDGTFPAHDLFPRLAAAGLLGLEYDPAYGGQGADHSYTLIYGEEIGRCGSAGVAMAIGVQTDMATPSLARFGSHELKERYLRPALTGEAVAAIAVTEPDAGSDVAAIRTRAEADGDEWVINGTKLYITNGTQADWVCVLARTGPGPRDMSQILVPTDTEGYAVSRKLDKLGNRASDTAELSFVDVRVPREHTIGDVNRGFQQQMAQFQNERLIAAYMATGRMRDALDRTIAYANHRGAFGQRLADHQWIQFKLAELVAELDIVTEYTHSCAEAVVAGVGRDKVTKMASIAKLRAARLQREVADWCLQFHGGVGYMEENWTAGYFRDSRLMSIGAGADEIMLRIIAQYEGIGSQA